MKIVVFGSTGGTGKEVVRQALAAGYQVTAFVRDSARMDIRHPNLALFVGDVLDQKAVESAIAGQDAVISTLGPTRPPVPGMMASAAQNIIESMKVNEVKRLISTTGAGVRDEKDRPKLSDHIMKALLTVLAKTVLEDSAHNVAIIRQSQLDWTVVRFPRLLDGKHTGSYHVGYLGKESGSTLSRADGADFILKELAEGKYLHQMPVVTALS